MLVSKRKETLENVCAIASYVGLHFGLSCRDEPSQVEKPSFGAFLSATISGANQNQASKFHFGR